MLYLVATELRLGAFVTAAINNADIEKRLGMDGYREGVLRHTRRRTPHRSTPSSCHSCRVRRPGMASCPKRLMTRRVGT